MSTRKHYYNNLPPVDTKATAPDLPPVPEPEETPRPPIGTIPTIPTMMGMTPLNTSAETTTPKPADPEPNDSDNWKDFDFDKVKVKDDTVRPLPKREMIRFVIVGIAGGVLVWLFRLALENWAMKPLFCRTPDTAQICVSAGTTSFIIALVVVGIVMSALLSHARVFRSILITLATFVSLGALWPMLDGHEWLVAALATALFATGLYLFFALTAALKKYLPAVILLALFTVGFWFLVRM